MPAAAVIPAPIVYVKFAAVEKLVVGFQVECGEGASGSALPHFEPFFWGASGFTAAGDPKRLP